MFNRKYSITKSKQILRRGYHLYKTRSTSLSTSQYTELENHLKLLNHALIAKDKNEASRLAHLVNNFLHTHFPKTFFDLTKEIVGALAFALIVAFCVRQFWFELYEVPTGSMRPTIEEQDRLAVSKTTFGINLPFTNKLWFFKPERIQRGGIIIFTTSDMDMADSNTRYFYLFPGKKRLVKRCVAKGGDTLYFYGGYIYGIDKDDNPILELADPSWLEKMGISHIDHIPMITFEGKTTANKPLLSHVYSETLFHQMNHLIGKLHYRENKIEGLFYNGKEWGQENLALLKQPHNKPVSYGDLWGMNNYAMVRMLTPNEAKKFYPEQVTNPRLLPQPIEWKIYLELRHTPNLTYPTPQLRQGESFIMQPLITPFKTLLPLDELHLERVMNQMTTARFVVKDERAYSYSEGKKRHQPVQFDPLLKNVPNGTYEYYKGTAYAIHFGGIRTKLKNTHPLYSKEPEFIQTLFNMGVGFNTLYKPIQPDQPLIPRRFAFYREGDLFVMGEPLFLKEELSSFVTNELAKQTQSSSHQPYIAFIDRSAPIKEGTLDIEFIKNFGLKVPEGTLVALGDNYAGSSDSRDFGFVPVHNLRGAPSFTFWPPGHRIGPLAGPKYPWLTLPNLLVWSIACCIILITIIYIKKRNNKSLF